MGNFQPIILLLLSVIQLSTSDSNSTTTSPISNANPVIVRHLTSKVTNGTLAKGTVHVLYKQLNKGDALDLMRVSIEVLDPEDFKNQIGPVLEATVSNGRNSFSLEVPVVFPNLTLYSDGKILESLMPEDFGTSKRSKKHISENSLTQNLIITIQSKLHLNVSYKVHLNSLDKSIYELRFKPGSSVIAVPNQHTTIVKPVGFYLDSVKQDVRSFHITVTSDDDICASLITIPSNESLYYRRADSEEIDNRRLMTFTRRADVFFSEAEIAEFKTFRIYTSINPDDTACSPKSSRKSVNENKKISFEFVKVESQSYSIPILAMLAFFTIPALPFLVFLTSFYKKQPIVVEQNLISFSNPSDSTGDNTAALVIPVGTEERSETLQDSELSENDSLSMQGELLRYPVAIILPVLMHTALEYHNFTKSSMANRDEMCFHNHACARPFGELRAWNNIVSNVGFAIYGFLFVAITMQRRSRLRSLKGFGTCECTLIDVTIGVFMVLQAIASATYHICPSDVAFQFDTPCIQVICGLLIVRQWLTRLESPSAAYSNFLLVGVVSLNFLASFLSKTFFARYVLAVIHAAVIVGLFSAKNIMLAQNEQILSKQVRYVFMTLFSVANLALMMIYLASSIIHLNQISTYCFILNCLLYLVYYSSMKIVCNEKITTTAKFYGVLAIAGWLLAAFFFQQDDTDWTISAAASRALNKPCLLFDFFGSHDLWHIFGACAGLFTFLFVSFVDDDLLNVPKSRLTLF